LIEYYGENVMRLAIQSRLDIFIQEMLTPYEVFQTYGIILWIYEEYYIFAFILLAYSVYTYWQNSS
jgi:cation-transporting P-type ATPase 13A2